MATQYADRLRPLIYSGGTESPWHTAFERTANLKEGACSPILNTDLIAGDGEGGLGGLKLSSARGFESLPALTQKENRDLIEKLGVKLKGEPGDAHFAWFVPGPAFVDNALIDECLQSGAVTPHFLAAVLAVDLEKPVFSEKRTNFAPCSVPRTRSGNWTSASPLTLPVQVRASTRPRPTPLSARRNSSASSGYSSTGVHEC